MRIIIEYCRARRLESALAVIDRLHCDALNVSAAKSIAVALAGSRSLPQAPNLVRVLNEEGIEFFRKKINPSIRSVSASPIDPASKDFENIYQLF